MPADTAGYENKQIERLIGSPIPLFNAGADPEDSKCVPLYNVFKPAILNFFYMCNHPTEGDNKTTLKGIMQEIIETYGYIFLVRANIAGLCPPIPDGTDEAFKEAWFSQLFDVPEDRKLSIVIQGGEAVNFYSMFKYSSVPTHDADTRILAGHHFNYLQDIATVPYAIKILMHQYRFFVAFGLATLLKVVLMDMQDTNSEYIKQFLPAWPTGEEGETVFETPNELFIPKLNGQNFYARVIRVGLANPSAMGPPPYDINVTRNIERLISIDTKIKFTPSVSQETYNCSIVDLFVPHRVMSTDPMDFGRIGQSDSIHSYFSTDQAKSTARLEAPPLLNPEEAPPNPVAVPPNPAGRIPSIELDLPIPETVSYLGNAGQTIKLRIVPHGFILFETIRMLLVSSAFARYNHSNKLLKYRQKLVVLLSTLMRQDISNSIYTMCLANKDQAIGAKPDLSLYLMGGRAVVANGKFEVMEPPTTPITKAIPLSMPRSTTPRNDTKAREFSRELLARDANGETVTAEGIGEDEQEKWEGYFDFLSYTNPDFKDFRLPKTEKDLQDEEDESKLIQELLAMPTMPIKSKGGYRRKTPRNKKAKRTTRKL